MKNDFEYRQDFYGKAPIRSSFGVNLLNTPDRILHHARLVMAVCGAAVIGALGWFIAGGGAHSNDMINNATGQVGDVAVLRGEATAKGSGPDRQLATKAAIFVGDLVRTGSASRLLLRLGERTTLRLGAQTEIKIVRYLIDAGGELDLTAGAIEFERSGKPSGDPLSIRSNYGLIAVRGTQFFAGPSNGKFAVFVTRGQVAVTGANSTTVTVSAKQGTDIAKPGDPPTAPVNWGQSRIDEAMSSVR